ncbi:MAG: efflux RND transporter permease subunit [Myxococcales bacterium]|nr:efflux RND transporter permease subunit [Myxococcales bacterium]
MLRAIVAAALRFRVLVAIASVAVMLLGVRAAQQSPLDVFPEFAPVLVEVQCEAPGLSSLDVEQLVTTPIEQNLAGTPFLASLRSKSVQGLSSVVVLFREGTDLLQARQLVQERVSRVAGLPLGARPPVLLSPLSSLSRVLKIGVYSEQRSQMEITDVIRWIVRPRLMSIPGVANVAIWGQRDRALQVQVDPDRLRVNGLTVDDVTRAVRDATSIGGGGLVELPSQRISVQQPPAATSAESLSRTLVLRPGARTGGVRLAAVATVVEEPPIAIGDGVINGRPGLLLIVEKQPWGNTLEVTRHVERALTELEPQLRGLRVERSIFRPATFVELAAKNLRDALALGCLFVVAVLLVFLRDRRAAMISAAAIPLSLAIAMIVLWARGATLNTLSLAGLTIALGEVVDDAIIDVENIERRLRDHATREGTKSRFAIVLDASLEVRSAVVYATLIVALVFLPVYFLPGLSGAFFRPLATTYVLAVAASLAVAVVVTPALSLLFLRTPAEQPRPSAAATLLERAYEPALRAALARPKAVVALAAAMAMAALPAARSLGEGFMPPFRERDFLMHWIAPPGTSLTELRRTVERVTTELRTIPGVRGVGSHLGRAEVADEVVGSNFAELWVSIAEDAPERETRTRIQQVVDGYPGIQRDVQTYLQERVKEVVSGAKGAIVLRIYGSDLDALQRHAAQIAASLRGVDGIANLSVEQQARVPQLELRTQPEALGLVGLTAGDVRTLAATLLQGQRVGQVIRDGRIIDVLVIGEARLRADPAALARVSIDAAGTPLRAVGSLELSSSPNALVHEGTVRRIDVTCDARGRDLGAVARDVERVARAHALPSDMRVELLGEYAARAEARARLIALSLLSLLGVFVVLYVDFRSASAALIVFVSLPFALVGGVAGAWIGGGVLSLGSLVGFVSVLGITARNGIILVSHYRSNEPREGADRDRERTSVERIVRASRERLVPILMTAAATALGLAPIAMAGDRPGHEIEHPMALVILGGLASSTLLNLFAMPAIFLLFGAHSERSAPE